MGYRLPPLNTLRIFEAAGRLGSFKAAAEEIHLTPSAVSHGIQTLEEWLGLALFTRSKNGLALTRSGEMYLPFVAEALELLTRGALALPGFAPQSQLSISSAPTFAARWLIPHLKSFQEAHPEFSVTLDTATHHIDFLMDGIDVAIRRGHGSWPGVYAMKLMEETLFPVAAPELLQAHGIPKAPADLASMPWLHVTSVTEDWPVWLTAVGAGAGELAPAVEYRFDAIHLAIDAAIQGLGVALGRHPLVDAELASGRLVKLFEGEVPCETAYWFVCANESLQWPGVTVFKQWLETLLNMSPSGSSP